MAVSATEVVARRRAGRRDRLAAAVRYAEVVRTRLPVRAVVVFGSVARGDWHAGSDIDVLVVADVPEGTRMLDRLEAAGPAHDGVQPLVWTVAEWSGRRARGDRYARACVEEGVWLLGSPDDLALDVIGAAAAGRSGPGALAAVEQAGGHDLDRGPYGDGLDGEQAHQDEQLDGPRLQRRRPAEQQPDERPR